MRNLISAFQGNRLLARVLRSSSWLVLGYGGSQFLRLVSNLILARLLFPEAFGLMALVSVVTVGLMMFSDVGIGPAIAQNKRGDDPEFLNTAWTIQVLRGFALWAGACALAWPMAQFYAAPELALYLPIAGISLALAGFNPTRIETAHRHLLVGRLTVLDLISQFIGIASMVVLAWITQSVIALVIGGVIGAAAKLALTHLYLPGDANRFRWEKTAAKELITFGKWIFLSTAFWFVSSQGDKAILGKFLSLDSLGIYNIGYFLASFPLLLGHAVNQRVMIPVYRDAPPSASPQNAAKLAKMHAVISAGVIGLLALMALAGPSLVGLLYDDRYIQAGGIVVLIACALIPQAIGMTYDQAALAAGDSRRFFVFSGSRAVVQVLALLIGITQFGLVGAITGLGLSVLVVHPVLIWLARVHGAWDARHDLAAAVASAGLIGLALWLHWDSIAALATL
ncbi:polysaccharide biosynthesis protein [Roseovarius faecimaris]|uniref:Polysaccharide biosynthesis protein n=1 Tax=Roseovarius faecimaris TaxID=2494550 RepID=A0A6I6ITT7_9RHOB|nr:oligosaccharide flippase family protein [Roseovarius faecimaris]QGX99504.1 polysaccharide biosynthesis protein [Roseovarius faecimaris]